MELAQLQSSFSEGGSFLLWTGGVVVGQALSTGREGSRCPRGGRLLRAPQGRPACLPGPSHPRSTCPGWWPLLSSGWKQHLGGACASDTFGAAGTVGWRERDGQFSGSYWKVLASSGLSGD